MKVILLLTMCLSLFACGNKNTKGSKTQEQPPQKDHVEVTWSSLFITKWKNGKDSTENLTEYAFAKALSAPDTFKANVTQKIRQLLK